MPIGRYDIFLRIFGGFKIFIAAFIVVMNSCQISYTFIRDEETYFFFFKVRFEISVIYYSLMESRD